MKLTRRGIFGLLPGAALGGKRALAEAAESLALGTGAVFPSGTPPMHGVPAVADNSWAAKALARLTTKAGLEDKWNDTHVSRFDPDLAVQHSRSLSSKYAEQKRRNFDRDLKASKTYYERILSGFFD